MSDDNKTSTSIQIGPGGAVTLTIVFLLLKVFGKIDWDWIWIFSPLWIGLAFFGVILACIALFGLIALIIDFADRK